MLRVKRKGNLFGRKPVNAKPDKGRGDVVGETYATVAIRNPAEPERVWEGEFLVDTGATDTLVPKQHLEFIGVVPEGQRVYGLADGNELRFDIAVARIEVMGELAGGTVIFGSEDAEPLLGVTVLESAGFEVDLHNETLNKLPASRMRGFRPQPSP